MIPIATGVRAWHHIGRAAQEVRWSPALGPDDGEREHEQTGFL